MVYILILNWNDWKDSIECVESCHKLDYPNFRIVIIDNGSSDGSEVIFRERFADIVIIQTGTNLGFAGGNNVGIRYALDHGAEYVWLLNNDTVVDSEALGELLKVGESETSIGMVGSKVMRYSEPDVIDFAKGSIDLQTGTTYHVGRGEKDFGQYDGLYQTDYLTGCSLLVKRAALEKVGLMPEEYFLYYEETDWCLRARRNGYKLACAPQSVIYHKVHSTTEKVAGAFLYYLTRNRLFFLEKYGENVDWWQRVIGDLSVIKNVFSRGLIKGFGEIICILRAYSHWLMGLGGQMETPYKCFNSFWRRKRHF